MSNLTQIVDRIRQARPEKYFHVSFGENVVKTSTSEVPWEVLSDVDPITIWAALLLSSEFFVVLCSAGEKNVLELAVFRNNGGMDAMGLASFVGMPQIAFCEQNKFNGDFEIVPGDSMQAYVTLPFSSSLSLLRTNVRTLIPVRSIGEGYSIPEPMDVAMIASGLGGECLSYEIHRLIVDTKNQQDIISPSALRDLREGWSEFTHEAQGINSRERALLHEMQALSRKVPI